MMNLCKDCVSINLCGNQNVTGCISYTKQDEKLLPFDADVELDKLYPIEMTNEEWFCSLPTEEKAKAMVEVSTRDSAITKRYYEYLLKEITEWLKQPHGEVADEL